MNRKLGLSLSLFLLFPLLYVSLNTVKLGVSTSFSIHNLNSGLNYSTIQEAIDAPETLDGHKIEVDSGTYYEHVAVSKSLFLFGQSWNTVIDGSGIGTVVTISADNVTVADLTIGNGGHGLSWLDSCIYGNHHSNIQIENNNVMNASNGIIFYGFSNSTMRRNCAYFFGGMGLHLDGGSTNCTILDNIVGNSLEGIVLEQSAGNWVEGNDLINNSVSIVVYSCGMNVFRGNSMSSTQYNFIPFGYDLGSFIQDIDASNIVNGKTLYYLTNLSDLTIDPPHYSNLGYLGLVNCTNITIRDFNLTQNGDGILFAYSAKCTLANITLSQNRGPLMWGGLTFYNSNNNTIICSEISSNSYAVCLYHSDGNIFYHNSFIQNGRQVVSDFLVPFSNSSSGYLSTSIWDDGYPSGGNYWNDYSGTDVFNGPYQNVSGSDGIGDSSYVIDVNNTDHYPLMGTFSSFSDLGYEVNLVSNSTIVDFVSYCSMFLNGSCQQALTFNALGPKDTTGFCRIMIPRTLIDGPYTIFVNHRNFTGTELPASNSSHAFLYFTYTHIGYVGIMPEFPSFLIVALFMTATLLVATVCRRVQQHGVTKRWTNDISK
jgi:parallel beta-helix repeat protein